MPDLPTGTVTFLFTDIEGSTALLQYLGDTRYAEALAQHRDLLRTAFEEGGGHEVDTQGDAFFVAFGRARDAVSTALAAQLALTAHPWAEGAPVRVRMGLHTGEPILAGGGYVGLDVHRAARMAAAGWGGQILLSQATRDAIEHDLQESVTLRDLGEHRLKDLQYREQIFMLVHPDLPTDFPPLRSLETLPNNLPRQLTSFIGREREMAEVKRMLTTTRLLTLSGAGGSGKTRLALQVAAELLEEFTNGVWLVELAALSDPALVPQAVVSALGLREEPGRPLLTTLTDYLRSKTLLLVLDNCEHLVAACAQLAEALLRVSPNLRILATTREVLGIAGETVWRVPSLSLPDLRRLPAFEQLTQYEAVRLFVERAMISRPEFALTSASAPSVAQVVHRLDGIPLAIELAAARVKVLSVDQIAGRLDDRFRLLTTGSRTALPRQQTLRAAIDWSYDLLSQQERTLLRRLSVFAGSWTLEAAETICAGDGVEEPDVLDLLMQLVDKSLVMMEEREGKVRYRLLETLRQYGGEKLLESGEPAAVRGRHRDWYLGLAERAEPELQGRHQEVWLERLETEHDNLRAGLEWSKTEAGGAEVEARLAGALHRFWLMRGYLSEGRDWLEGAVSRSNGAPAPARAKALYGGSALAFYQGEYGRAVALSQESLAVYRQLGDRLGVALSLNILGGVTRNQGDHARATALFEESLALSRQSDHKWALAETLNALGIVARRQGDYGRATALGEESLVLWRDLGDKRGLAASLSHLGIVARYQGNYERARTLHEEGLALRRELGDKADLATSLGSLGTVAMNLGDYERAGELFEESLTLCRELGNKIGTAAALGNLGVLAHRQGDDHRAAGVLQESLALWRELGDRQAVATALTVLGMVAHALGDYERAAALYRESLVLYRELKDKLGIAQSLGWLARSVGTQGRPAPAARLFGAAEALREAIGAPLPPADRADYDRSVAAVRVLLDEEAFKAAWAQGRAMTLEEAMNEALRTEDEDLP